MKEQKYVKAAPGNPRYAGIYFYQGKGEKQSVVIQFRGEDGKPRTETLGDSETITLEKAYEERQKRRNKPIRQVKGKEALFLPPLDALFKQMDTTTAKGKRFANFYAIHKDNCSFQEIALAYLITNQF